MWRVVGVASGWCGGWLVWRVVVVAGGAVWCGVVWFDVV